MHFLAGIGFIGFWCIALLYFLPAIVGMCRKKQNAGAIFALNLLTGWTFIGWVGALVWALTNEAPVEPGTAVERKGVY